jgi:hypothetical protein
MLELFAAALLLAAPPEKPTPAEARRVIEYHYGGQGQGPVLAELVPCLDVDADPQSKTKGECLEEVAGKLKKGAVVYAWMQWLVPLGDAYEDVVVQFLHEGNLRSAQDVKLAGVFRTRSWRSNAATRSVTWQIRVVRGKDTLGEVSFQVE